MGSGSSSRRHNHFQSVDGQKHKEDTKPHTEEPLPFLRKSENDTSEATPESRKIHRERFQRILKIVRNETKSLDAFNSAAFNRRKKHLATVAEDSVKRERKDRLSYERGISLELERDSTNEIKDELMDACDMLYTMIGYELSEDEDEEEEHNINNDLSSDTADSQALANNDPAVISRQTVVAELEAEGEGDEVKSSVHVKDPIEHSLSFKFDEDDEVVEGHNIFADGISDSEDNDAGEDSEEGSAYYSTSGSEESDYFDHDNGGKDDDCRPSALTTQEKDEYINDTHDLDHSSRRGSLAKNQQIVHQKQREHALHSVMRQASLQERQARASLKLEKRKRKTAELKKRALAVAADDLIKDGGEDRDADYFNARRRGSIDEDTFEAKKNVLKTYKAHDHVRRGSVAGRQNKQREALERRLKKRREEQRQEPVVGR